MCQVDGFHQPDDQHEPQREQGEQQPQRNAVDQVRGQRR
jgi:hypothetical protein